MSETIQMIIVGIIVILAALIAIRKILLMVRGKGSGCPSCTGSSDCPLCHQKDKKYTSRTDCPVPKSCPDKRSSIK